MSRTNNIMFGRGTQGNRPADATKTGRANGRQQSQQRRGQQQRCPSGAAKFEGRCPDLKGHIYDMKEDLFMKTTKEVALYVGRTYKYGADIKMAVESLTMPAIEFPPDPPAGATWGETLRWEKLISQQAKREDNLATNNQSLYSLVWGQCTEALQAKVEAANAFEVASSNNDGIELLKIIKDIALNKEIEFNFQSKKYLAQAIAESVRNFHWLRQGTSTAQDYLEKFNNHLKVLEHVGANVWEHPGLVAEQASGAPVTAAHRAAAREKYLATLFLTGCDRSRYGKLIENLENGNLQGVDMYPKTLTDAYHLLSNWQESCTNVVTTPVPTIDNKNPGSGIISGQTVGAVAGTVLIAVGVPIVDETLSAAGQAIQTSTGTIQHSDQKLYQSNMQMLQQQSQEANQNLVQTLQQSEQQHQAKMQVLEQRSQAANQELAQVLRESEQRHQVDMQVLQKQSAAANQNLQEVFQRLKSPAADTTQQPYQQLLQSQTRPVVAVTITCPSNHPTSRVFHHSDHWCDICKRTIPTGTTVSWCPTCDWDACSLCK